MLTDVEAEAPPARRLIVFGALFLGLLALAQITFARPVPLLAPPVVLAIVMLCAAAGLLVWIRGRWSRTLIWTAVAIAVAATGAAALAARPTAGLGAVVMAATGIGMLAAVTSAASLVRPGVIPAPYVKAAGRVALAAVLVLGLTTPAAGAGARLALTTAAVLILLGWMLRPEASD